MDRPVDKFISRLQENGCDPRETSPGEWLSRCPSHEDNNPSLSVGIGDNGGVIFHCHAKCSSTDVVYALGLSMSELFPERANRIAGNVRIKNKPAGKKTAEYEYRDAEGVLVYKTVRRELPEGGKTFSQMRPNGQGGWINSVKGIERVLYQLPELIAADKSKTVYVAEGEKKVEALRKWGLIATCNVGGAGKWSPKYSKYLAGRNVVILPDNDPVDPNTGRCPGMDHARKVIESLAGVAASVKILALPDLPSKGDIVDWQEAGHGLPEFMQLVEALQSGPDETQKIVAAVEDKGKAAVAAKRDPVSTAFEEAILAEVGLDVLGELEDSGGKVKVFSSHHRKTDVISDTAKLTYERLLQICGPGIKAKVFTGKNKVPEGMHQMSDIRNAIALASGFRRVTDDSEVGRGIWQGIDDAGEPNKTVVLVGAGEAARWNGDKILHRVLVPRSEGRILDLGSSEPWFDHAGLSEFLTSAESDDWCIGVVEEATELFARWRWKFQEETPSLITGLVLANWVQTVFAWRPMVAIAGDSNTGKSSLFMALSGLFGSLTLKSSDSSAAALRQKIGRTSPVVMCDEFENSGHREEILKMLRSASRGDKVLRGTTGSQKGKEFSLRHIVWTAATESGLRAEPDINRFIVCDLIPPPESEFGKLDIPPAGKLGNLGQRLLAVAVRRVIDARNLAVQLKAVHYEGRHPRVIENYAVPAAMLAMAAGMGFDDATGVLGRILKIAGKDEILNDKQRLIDAILESQIDCGHGERATVAQAISLRSNNPKFDETLERHGIKIIQDEDGIQGGLAVFIVHSAVARMLLRGTEWEKLSIDQILLRLPGARRSRHWIGESNPRGVMIPAKSFGIGNSEMF